MRPSTAFALAAALGTAAPALGAPEAGLSWVSICTEHGVALHPMPKERGPDQQGSTACHAVCTLPRKGAGRRS